MKKEKVANVLFFGGRRKRRNECKIKLQVFRQSYHVQKKQTAKQP